LIGVGCGVAALLFWWFAAAVWFVREQQVFGFWRGSAVAVLAALLLLLGLCSCCCFCCACAAAAASAVSGQLLLLVSIIRSSGFVFQLWGGFLGFFVRANVFVATDLPL